MKYFVRFSSLSIIVFIISLFITVPALAVPPLPSSFYGTVKVNNANVPDGTVIQALIGGQVYAEGFTQTYQGNSVYALDVRGDDSETAVQDGGREGDAIQFKVGGISADQTAIWHAGTNVTLNLTASSSGPIITPQATPSPVPTQTAILLIQPSSTPAASIPSMPTVIVQASPTPVIIVQPSQVETQTTQPSEIATKPFQPSPMPTILVQASLIPAASENDQDNDSSNTLRVVFIIITLVLVLIIGYTFLILRKKKI